MAKRRGFMKGKFGGISNIFGQMMPLFMLPLALGFIGIAIDNKIMNLLKMSLVFNLFKGIALPFGLGSFLQLSVAMSMLGGFFGGATGTTAPTRPTAFGGAQEQLPFFRVTQS